MPSRQSRMRRRRPTAVADALAKAAAAERAGDAMTALAALLDAVRGAPGAAEIYPPLTRLLIPMRFQEASPAVVEAVGLALASPFADPQLLAPAAISLLRARHGFRDAGAPGVSAALGDDPLLSALLERALLPDPELEAALTASRRRLLTRATDDGPVRYVAALAAQALLNGWMWAESVEETAAVEELVATLADAPAFGFRHLVLALYRPLADLPDAAELAASAKSPWRQAARTLIAEPLEERRLAAKTPRLGFAPNAATEAVKAQYEAFPYPRWTAVPRRRPRPIREVAGQLFPASASAEWPVWPAGGLDVLIAGCGTGKHVADVATRFRGARVLGLDLSRTALGYAARKLKGMGDVAFAEADILALDDFERRFDHIESVGVLHHLADPLAGWRALVGLLKPGGSMRVGFYCRRGRARIQAAREALAAAGFHGRTDADLRRARAHALAAGPDDPAGLAAGELDFYAASGARDFLFHAHEVEYRPRELAEMVEALGLQVLGLELTDARAAERYRRRFPDDAAMADLRRWDEIETEAPDTFRHMCQFWAALPRP